MSKLLLTLVASLLVSALCQVSVPEVDTDRVSFESHIYQFFPVQESWESAQEICEAWGGNLVSIQSQEESNFLASFAPEDNQQFWIGLTNTIIDGRWMWTDKDAHEFAISLWNSTQGAPDALESQDQCIYADGAAQDSWFLAPCDEARNFVCKRRDGPACPWDFNAVGAPRPELTTQTSNGVITLTVRMGKYPHANTHYAFTFSEFDVTSRQCDTLSNIVNTLDDWEVIEEDDCFATYSLRLTVSEFISVAQPDMSSNEESDIINIDTPMYIVYQTEQQSEDESLCVITTFETRVRMRLVLQQESEVVGIEFTGGDILDPILYSAITINNEGRLVIDAILVPTSEDFWLTDISFQNHSRNIPFRLESEADCDNFEPFVGCHYRVSLVSTETRDDYSGFLKIGFQFNWPQSSEPQEGFVLLKLVYAIVQEPPALEGIINVVSNLVRSNFMEIVDFFTPFETVRVLSETNPPIEVSDARLRYTDAWLCCTRDRLILAPYNPEEGQYGCTQFDDSIMSLWEPLIVNGEAQESLRVNIVDLGPMIHSKAAFSFDPIGLYGEDKLCYIHARTRLDVNGEIDTLDNRRGGKTLVPRGSYESHSEIAISFKSCTIFQHKDECVGQNKCSWKEELALCWNSAKHPTAGAASARAAGGVVVLVLSVLLGLLVL